MLKTRLPDLSRELSVFPTARNAALHLCMESVKLASIALYQSSHQFRFGMKRQQSTSMYAAQTTDSVVLIF